MWTRAISVVALLQYLSGVGQSFNYTITSGNKTTLFGVCDWGLWNFWPVAAGHCGECSGDECGDIVSLWMECDSDYAKVFFYDEYDCEGDPINSTYLEYWYCDAGTCPDDYVVDMGLTEYEDMYCSGGVELEAVIPVTYVALACIDSGIGLWYNYIFIYNVSYLLIYDNEYCNGTVYDFDVLFYDGYCDNGTEYSFENVGEDTRLSGPCNYAVWNNWPIAEGYCGSCEGDNCGNIQSLYAYCYDDDSAIINFYNDAFCGLAGGDFVNSTYADAAMCRKDTCDPDDIVVMSFVEREESDCSGDDLLDVSIEIVDGATQCYAEDGFYLGITTSEDGFFYGVYLDEYCNGTIYLNFTFEDGYCDNGTEYSFDDYESGVITSTFECDWALLNVWPLAADDFCNMCNGNDCDGIGSLAIECTDDDAMVIEYSDNECEDEMNVNYTEIYDCDTSDDCDNVYIITVFEYTGSENCTGEASFNATLYVAEGSVCYQYALQPFAFYVGIESSVDGISLGYYLSDDCASGVIFSGNYTDGYCDQDGGNSSLWQFSEYVPPTTSSPMNSISSTSSNSSSSATEDDSDSTEDNANTLFDKSGLILSLIVSFGAVAKFW